MNTKPTRAAILVFAGLLLLTASFFVWGGSERLSTNFSSFEQAALVALDKSSKKSESAPRLVNGAWPLGIEAKAFAVALVRPAGELDILLEKNGRERLPIASVAKLLTAMVAADELKPAAEVILRPEHFPDKADLAGLQPGELFQVRDLLYPLLISSSNAAAVALASETGQARFVVLMNRLAESQGFRDTYF
jgi:D-alanyl-D-alanine carboxypeptidase